LSFCCSCRTTPECGKEVSDSVRFCDNCGHKFSETVVDVVSEQNEPTQISGEIDTNAKKVKKKKLYCTNCGAVLNNFKIIIELLLFLPQNWHFFEDDAISFPQ